MQVDIGQGAVPWVVLTDPEGNELCVLEPRDAYQDTGPVAAVVLDAAAPTARRFGPRPPAGPWSAEVPTTRLRAPEGRGPYIELISLRSQDREEPHAHRRRPHADGDLAAEVARLTALGATPVDIGQGAVPWAVLADPEGNEFCVLSRGEIGELVGNRPAPVH